MSKPILIFLILCLIGIFVGYSYHLKKKKEKTITSDNLSDEVNEATISQEEVTQTYNVNELIEISWEFLTRITNYVLNKFTEENQNKVLDIGKKLINCGFAYHHVVYNQKNDNPKGKSKDIELKR